MQKKLIAKMTFISVVFLILAACSPLNPVVVPKQSTYALNPTPIKASRGITHSAITLLVLMPEASPGYNSTDMIYSQTPHQLQSYANNIWIAPPAQMLLPLLVQQLESTGHFHAVVRAPFSGVVQYRLTTQLLELRQNFSQATSTVHMAVAVQLIDNRTQRLLASQTFKAIVAAPGNNPESGVDAANRATQSILQQISRFVVRNS